MESNKPVFLWCSPSAIARFDPSNGEKKVQGSPLGASVPLDAASDVGDAWWVRDDGTTTGPASTLTSRSFGAGRVLLRIGTRDELVMLDIARGGVDVTSAPSLPPRVRRIWFSLPCPVAPGTLVNADIGELRAVLELDSSGWTISFGRQSRPVLLSRIIRRKMTEAASCVGVDDVEDTAPHGDVGVIRIDGWAYGNWKWHARAGEIRRLVGQLPDVSMRCPPIDKPVDVNWPMSAWLSFEPHPELPVNSSVFAPVFSRVFYNTEGEARLVGPNGATFTPDSHDPVLVRVRSSPMGEAAHADGAFLTRWRVEVSAPLTSPQVFDAWNRHIAKPFINAVETEGDGRLLTFAPRFHDDSNTKGEWWTILHWCAQTLPSVPEAPEFPIGHFPLVPFCRVVIPGAPWTTSTLIGSGNSKDIGSDDSKDQWAISTLVEMPGVKNDDGEDLSGQIWFSTNRMSEQQYVSMLSIERDTRDVPPPSSTEPRYQVTPMPRAAWNGYLFPIAAHGELVKKPAQHTVIGTISLKFDGLALLAPAEPDQRHQSFIAGGLAILPESRSHAEPREKDPPRYQRPCFQMRTGIRQSVPTPASPPGSVGTGGTHAVILIPLNEQKANGADVIISEHSLPDWPHKLDIELQRASRDLVTDAASPNLIHPTQLLVLSPSDLFVALVQSPLGLTSSEVQTGARTLAIWRQNGEPPAWEIRNNDVIEVRLPPQCVGEAMERFKDGDGPVDIASGALVNFRYPPMTRLQLSQTNGRKLFADAGWDLPRVLGGDVTSRPSPRLVSMQSEFLYGLECRMSLSDVKVRELFARLGRVMTEPPSEGSNAYWRAFHAWTESRLAVLELYRDSQDRDPFNRSSEERELRVVTNRDERIRWRLRLGLSEPTGDPWSPTEQSYRASPFEQTVGPGLLAGGATWGFESKKLLDRMTSLPNSTGGELCGVALSSLGAWARQRALFDNGLTIIESTTECGRVSRYQVSRLGRIGAAYNRAKHVVIYERTVLASDQFVDEQDSHAGRPILRKTQEFIEILQPERRYPDIGSSPLNGFLSATDFGHEQSSVIIPVNGRWGRDVTKGWEVPLWNTSADPYVYPKPNIWLRFLTPEGEISELIEEPEKLHFWSEIPEGVQELSPNTDTWLPQPGVDFIAGYAPPTDPEFGNAAYDQPPRPGAVIPGYERFTLKVSSRGPQVDLNKGRSNAPMTARVRTITFMRATVKDADPNDEEYRIIAEAQSAARTASNLALDVSEASTKAVTITDLDQLAIKARQAAADISNKYIDVFNASKPVADAEAKLVSSLQKSADDGVAGFVSRAQMIHAMLTESTPARPSELQSFQNLALQMVHALGTNPPAGAKDLAAIKKQLLIHAQELQSRTEILIRPAWNMIERLFDLLNDVSRQARQAAELFSAKASNAANRAFAVLAEIEAAIKQGVTTRVAELSAELEQMLAILRAAVRSGVDRARSPLTSLAELRAGASADLGTLINTLSHAMESGLDAASESVRALSRSVLSDATDMNAKLLAAKAQLDQLLNPVRGLVSKLESDIARRQVESTLGVAQTLTRDLTASLSLVGVSLRTFPTPSAVPDAAALVDWTAAKPWFDRLKTQAEHAKKQVESDAKAFIDEAIGRMQATLGHLSRAPDALRQALQEAIKDAIKERDACLAGLATSTAAFQKLLDVQIREWPNLIPADELEREVLSKLRTALSEIQSTSDIVRPIVAKAIKSITDAWRQAETAAGVAIGAVREHVQTIENTVAGLLLDAEKMFRELLTDPAGLGRWLHPDSVRQAMGAWLSDLVGADLGSTVNEAEEAINKIFSSASDKVGDWKKSVDNARQSAKDGIDAWVEQKKGLWINVAGVNKAIDDQKKIAENSIKEIEKATQNMTEDAARTIREELAKVRDAVDFAKSTTASRVRRAIEAAKGLDKWISVETGAMRLVRAFGEPPSVPGLTFDAPSLGYLFRDPHAIDITPVKAWANRVGDAVKGFSAGIPTKQIIDGFKPDADFLSKLDVSKLLPNLGGLRLGGLFPGLKIPADLAHLIKVEQHVDKQTLTARLKASLDLKLKENATLLPGDLLNIAIIKPRLFAEVIVEVSADGVSQQQTRGSITGDLVLRIAGYEIIGFKDTVIKYSEPGQPEFQLGKADLSGPLAFISDAAKLGDGGGGDDKESKKKNGISTEILRGDNGIVRGFLARLDITVPPVSGGVAGFSNLFFGAGVGIVLDIGKDGIDFTIFVHFNIASKESPFTITVLILGGAGYLDVGASCSPITGRTTLDAELGIFASASIAIGLGPIQGRVYAYLGITAALHTGSGRPASFTVAIVFIIGGEVKIFGFIEVSISVMLELSYTKTGDQEILEGRGTIAVRVKIGWFRITVRRSISYRKVSGSGSSMLSNPDHTHRLARAEDAAREYIALLAV